MKDQYSSNSVRKPPYANVASARLAVDPRPELRVYIGIDCWARAKTASAYTPAVCLPSADDPACYNWSVATGYPIWLIAGHDTATDVIEQLAGHLLAAGASVVRASRNGTLARYGDTPAEPATADKAISA